MFICCIVHVCTVLVPRCDINYTSLSVSTEEPPSKKRRSALPSNSSLSVSQSAKKSLDSSCHREIPSYCHWFALCLYDIYKSAQALLNTQSSSTSFTLTLDKQNYDIHLPDLNRAHDAIKAACSACGPLQVRGIMSDECLAGHELTFTIGLPGN